MRRSFVPAFARGSWEELCRYEQRACAETGEYEPAYTRLLEELGYGAEGSRSSCIWTMGGHRSAEVLLCERESL